MITKSIHDDFSSYPPHDKIYRLDNSETGSKVAMTLGNNNPWWTWAMLYRRIAKEDAVKS